MQDDRSAPLAGRIVGLLGRHRLRWSMVGLSFVLILAIVGSWGGYVRDEDSAAHFEDKDLIQNFVSHRKDFERLHLMAQGETSIRRVTGNATTPEQLTSTENARAEEYRMLLRSIGPVAVLEISKDHKVISLTSTSVGLVTHNSQKGYLYSEEPPASSELYPSLDGFSKNETGNGYRHIEGKWYLFFTGY